MRKWMCLFIAVILTVSLSSSLFAKKSVLIDFNLLKANGDGLDPDKSLAKEDAKMKDYTDHDSVNRTQHMSTLLDYSSIAGSSFIRAASSKNSLTSRRLTLATDLISFSCQRWVE